jgi:hypothetical protein
VGATASLLLVFGFVEFLDTLPVTSGELLFLKTRNPFLISQALTHILRGSVSRGVLALILALLLLSLIWMVAASLGRLATVETMIDYFRTRFHDVRTAGPDAVQTRDISKQDLAFTLLRVNFLRIVLVLAGMTGLGGAALIAGFTSSPANPRPVLAFLVFAPIAGLVCLIWCTLNWCLSLATVFVVRDGEDAVDAISSAANLFRNRTGAVFAVTTWTGLTHLIAFAGASTAVSIPLAFAGVLPWRLVALAVLLLTLIYFAVADWLYTARLAGYVCIAEMPDILLAPPAPPIVPSPPIAALTIDKDELILSDLPQPLTG